MALVATPPAPSSPHCCHSYHPRWDSTTSSFKLDGWEDPPPPAISFKGKVRSWTHNFFLHSPWPGPSQWAASNRRENKSAAFILGGHGSELGAVLEDGEDGRWSLPHLFPSLPVFPHLSHRVASPRVQLSPVLLTTSHCCVN